MLHPEERAKMHAKTQPPAPPHRRWCREPASQKDIPYPIVLIALVSAQAMHHQMKPVMTKSPKARRVEDSCHKPCKSRISQQVRSPSKILPKSKTSPNLLDACQKPCDQQWTYRYIPPYPYPKFDQAREHREQKALEVDVSSHQLHIAMSRHCHPRKPAMQQSIQALRLSRIKQQLFSTWNHKLE